MKYKTLILFILTAQILAFIFTLTVSFGFLINDRETISNINSSTYQILLVISSIIYFVGALISFWLCSKLENLTNIEEEQGELEKEKEIYRQASQAFIRTFQIKSEDLL